MDLDYASKSPEEIADAVSKLPLGHDLTKKEEHEMYMACANELYKLDMEKLRAIEMIVSQVQVDSFKYPVTFHIALKTAISKKIFETLPPVHCTVVFALYKEFNRILPKGAEKKAGECDPNGEDFIRVKHRQMSWLFENKKDSSWTLMGIDDGCDGLDKKTQEQLTPSADLMEQIAKGEGYDNVSVHRLKQAILDGTCAEAGLDVEKLKSEKWNPDDKLVASSQKAGAILLGLHLAKKEGEAFPDKQHIIVYTDSDLSTDLALSGLNFDTIINGKCECSVSQRFGEPFAVNCGKLLTGEEGGGIAAGMPLPSRVHLTLRHKLRSNLLPPLVKIIDTNCGHKALTPATAVGTVSMVKDYKGSFDIDWLMCVGIVAKKAGKEPIGTTPIPWVNSVGESNFWSAPGAGAEESPEEKKRKSCESWFKIFATMIQMHGWHAEELDKLGLLTDECKGYVEWVNAMDLDGYVKLTDKILEKLGDKEVNMPADEIMGMTLDEMKACTA